MTTGYERTVHGLVEHLAATSPDVPFLYFEDAVYSYADINRAASRVAAGFEAIGVGRNSKVAIMLGNCPEFLFIWFGLCKLGAVEVPINTAHKGELLSYMLRQADCEAILVEPDFLDQLDAVIGELPLLRHVVLLRDAGGRTFGGKSCISYDAFIANNGTYQKVDVKPGDPCAIMFTSGTTGPSKGAVVPHNYEFVQAEIVCEMARYTPADRLYNALPLFHGNAQTLSTMPALISGASMVLARRFSASRFWDDIRRYQCTEFNYIGGILSILLKADPKSDDADNPLRVMVGAGANRAVAEAFEKRFNVILTEGYGMSEIGSPFSSTLETRRPGSCGKLNSRYHVRLVDDDGREVGVDEPGELLIRPLLPNAMMLEYYGMPEKTVEAWQDLWFHTGDYLKKDADGFYYFVDRKKDAIRRRGENISSFEVERGVNSHPAVLESAAVAVKSELGEDEVLICVALKPGETLSAEELIAHCQSRMASFMVPRYVRFLEKLPKTPTERVQKYLLRSEGVTPDCYDREVAQAKRIAG